MEAAAQAKAAGGARKPGTAILRHRFLLAVLVCGLVLRVLYFAEIYHSPCYAAHLAPQSDMGFFDQVGREIAAGDLLLDRAIHPLHQWHRDVAAAYFREHGLPDDDPEAMQALWDRWYDGKRYHQEPLYTYLVGLLYFLFGTHVGVVFALQSLAGLGTICLVYLISDRVFGRRTARIAAVLAVLYAPLLFYEMVLLRATLITFTGMFLVWLSLRVEAEPWPRRAVLLGFACGLAVLLKSVFILYAGGMLVYLLARYRSSQRRGLAAAGALAAGLLLALAPLVARNLAVGAAPFSSNSVTPVTFLAANAPDAHPGRFSMGSSYIPGIMGATDGALLPVMVRTLGEHTPASYAQLMLGKTGFILHWYENPNNVNFYYYRLHSAVLRLLPVQSLMVLPLMLAGIVLALAGRRRCLPLCLLVALHVFTILLVYVAARFRIPLVVAGIPFAAYAVDRLVDLVWRRRFLCAAALLAPVLALAAFIGRPLQRTDALIRFYDYYSVYDYHYRPLLAAAERQGDVSTMLFLFGEILATEPGYMAGFTGGQPPLNRTDRELARYFADIHDACARVLAGAGQAGPAAVHAAAAARLREALAAAP